ncbi:MAG TPA: PD-(D/E)XK nuclease family protein [Acidobacteriota bacterium]|nr:PD-(D/E)XK nuclease family protein [Acidobacteriota bacterium]
MTAFSISRIGTYEKCPLQYKYAYIDRIKVEAEDTVETFLGSRVHEALEKLYRDKQYEKQMSLDELLDYYNQIWEEKWKDSVIIVKDDYTQDNYRKIGERQLKDYFQRHAPFDEGRILGLETKRFLPLDEQGKYSFHIRIDRLMYRGDGLYEVHDYKTGSFLIDQETLDRDRQLAMYSLWVKEQFKDFKKARLVWHFLNFDKEMESFRTHEELEDLRQEILEEIKYIEAADEFPANVSELCSWCLYKPICPEWKHQVELEGKEENEYLNDPGLKLVDEYVRLKDELKEHQKEAGEKLKKIEEALIVFCEKEGVSAVAGSEKKISVNEYKDISFPGKSSREREELEALLREIGKWDEVCTVDVHTLKNVFKSRDWGESELALLKKYAEEKRKFRFTIKNK